MDSVFQILLFGGLIFLMMRFGCGSHMFGHKKDGEGKSAGGGGCCGGGGGNKRAKVSPEAKASPANQQLRWTAPEMDTDPVCGKKVLTENAKSSIHDGQVYYFCSPECREMFEASPHLHLKEEGNSVSSPSSALEHRPGGGGSHA